MAELRWRLAESCEKPYEGGRGSHRLGKQEVGTGAWPKTTGYEKDECGENSSRPGCRLRSGCFEGDGGWLELGYQGSPRSTTFWPRSLRLVLFSVPVPFEMAPKAEVEA